MDTVVDERSWARSKLDRVLQGVCQRAFSSPEALLYEATIAESLRRVVLPALSPHVTGRRLLDVGAGGGRLAVAFADGHFVVGIDPSWAQVRRFRRRAAGCAGMVQAVGECIPFASDTFDTVYSSCVFKHWPSPSTSLDECARVTRPGGRLLTVEIDGAASPEEFRKFADRSRVPVGLRSGYVRFAMRTVIGVAPTAEELASSFTGVAVRQLSVQRFSDMPFLIAVAVAD